MTTGYYRYYPSRGPRTRTAGRNAIPRDRLEKLTWFILRVRPQSAIWDHGGPEGETLAQRDHRLATIAEKALRAAGAKIGCAAAFVPTEAFWRAHNGFAVRRKQKTRFYRPVMPGYLFAGFTTPTPPWAEIENLAGGLTIRGAVIWTTATHPEGEPKPMSFDAIAQWAIGSANPVIEAPDHHKIQPTGRELNVGDPVRVPLEAFSGWVVPIARIREDGLAELDLDIAGKIHTQAFPLEKLEFAA